MSKIIKSDMFLSFEKFKEIIYNEAKRTKNLSLASTSLGLELAGEETIKSIENLIKNQNLKTKKDLLKWLKRTKTSK